MPAGTAPLFAILWLVLAGHSALATEFSVYSQDVIGTQNRYTVKKGETLIEIARAFDLGYNEIADANPGEDPFTPKPGTMIRIPMEWVLPDGPRNTGILVNLAEMRLYCFHGPRGKSVSTFPIGIGDEGSDTPVGRFTVVRKSVNPAWNVPRSIRREKPYLPPRVPPGPDNPLGSHAMRLSRGSILIHGTNKPWGVGRRVSHGCIRLYPEDIARLYRLVPVGARVTVTRQPVKLGIKNGRIFIEVHKGGDFDYPREAVRLIGARKLLLRIDPSGLFTALREKTGIPTDISAKVAKRSGKPL